MKTTMTIGAENFKRAVKAAVSCCVYATVPALGDVYIDIGKNGAFIACDLEQYVRCSFNPIKYSDDTLGVSVDFSILKKIADMKGEHITFIYDEDSERELKISNGKKIVTMACLPVDNSAGSNDFNRESYSLPFEMDKKEIMHLDSEELLIAVKNASVFTAKTDAKPILKGYHLNGHDNVIETIDGYHCMRKDWKSGTMDSNYFETVCGKLSNVKSVFNKNDGTIAVYGVEYKDSKLDFGKYKYTMFSLTEGNMKVDYAVRNMDGEFHPVSSAYPTSFKTEGTAKIGSLMELCKEYGKFITPKEVVPIVFHQTHNDGTVYASLRTKSIKLCEPTEIKLCGNPLSAGYKNAYLMDGLSVFDKNDTVNLKTFGNLNPMLIENDEYHVLVLPIRLAVDSEKEIEKDIALLNSKEAV